VIPRLAFYGAAALAMAVAVLDLTGSALLAAAAAAIPLLLGATNIMPFAGWALPVAAVAWALFAGDPPAAGDAAAAAAEGAVLAAAAPAR